MIKEIADILCTLIKVAKDFSPLFIFLAIVISWLTLREIAKQRKESYKPRLMFQNKNFFLQKNSDGTPSFINEYSDKSKNNHGPEYTIELRNIGLGSAHDIQIQWLFKHPKMLSKLKDYAETTGKLKVNSNNHFEYLFDSKSNDGYGFYIKPSKKEVAQIAFIANNESVEIKLPDTIKNFITFLPYLELVSQSNPRRVNFDSEEISISIDFRFLDIGGKHQHQKLNVFIESCAYSEELHDPNYGLGSIKFKS